MIQMNQRHQLASFGEKDYTKISQPPKALAHIALREKLVCRCEIDFQTQPREQLRESLARVFVPDKENHPYWVVFTLVSFECIRANLHVL